MGMIQNAFANSSFSLLVGKIQGTIVDYLMPPLSIGRADHRPRSAPPSPAPSWSARGLAGDARLARRPRHSRAIPGRDLVRADGQHDARLPRPDHLDLGREVRPCRRGHQFRRRAAVAAVGHLLFDRQRCRRRSAPSATPIPSSTSSPASATASSAWPIPRCCSARLLLLAINVALGTLCYALLRSGWKLKP